MIGRRESPPASEGPKLKGFDDFDLRLGDVMRGERATLGKSLLDVQRDLKIKATYIAAIENADPTAFETQGFIAGYVRSYARYLGLDPEWAYERFCAEGNFETAHGMSPAASTSRTASAVQASSRGAVDPFADPDALFVPRGEALLSRIEPGAIGSLLVLVMLISAIGYGAFSVFRAVQRVDLAPVDAAAGVSGDLSGLADAAGATGATGGDGPRDAALARPSADALDRLYRPQALDLPVLTARDAPIATLDPSDIGTLAAPLDEAELAYEPEPDEALPEEAGAAPTGDTAVQVVGAEAPEVVLFAVRPSWVRVQAADGTVIFEKILDVGEKFTLPATEEPPLLRAGNSGSVYFTVNGRNYGPAGTGPSVVKNIPLSPDALTAKYAEADVSKDSDLARFLAVAQAEAGN